MPVIMAEEPEDFKKLAEGKIVGKLALGRFLIKC